MSLGTVFLYFFIVAPYDSDLSLRHPPFVEAATYEKKNISTLFIYLYKRIYLDKFYLQYGIVFKYFV